MVDKQADSGTERTDDQNRAIGGAWNEAFVSLLDELEDRGQDEFASTVLDGIVEFNPVQAAGLWLATPIVTEMLSSGWSTTGNPPLSDTERAAVERLAREFPMDGAVDQCELPFERIEHAGQQERERTDQEPAVFVRFPLRRHDEHLGVLGLLCHRRLSKAEIASVRLLSRLISAEMSGHKKADPETGQGKSNPSSATSFIALIAHELRTPLTGLRGNVQLASMALRKGDTARAETRLQAVVQAVDGITAFVQNLQDMSHLERGMFQIAVTPANLTIAVQNAAKRAERINASERHTIEIELPQSVVTSHDPVRMEQVFFNLLMNAMQYSIDGGTIRVLLDTKADSAVVKVTDPGIGIPPEEQAQIFEPYFRGESAKKVSAKGLGIGLTICRATVERHGGQIKIESSGMSGTTISIRLPLNAESAQA